MSEKNKKTTKSPCLIGIAASSSQIITAMVRVYTMKYLEDNFPNIKATVEFEFKEDFTKSEMDGLFDFVETFDMEGFVEDSVRKLSTVDLDVEYIERMTYDAAEKICIHLQSLSLNKAHITIGQCSFNKQKRDLGEDLKLTVLYGIKEVINE